MANKKRQRRCGDCVHYEACATWNVGSLLNTDATHCVNYRADVRPVVRGEWTEISVDDMGELGSVTSMRCDQCGLYHNEVYLYGTPTDNVNFCPHCGADCREVNTNE